MDQRKVRFGIVGLGRIAVNSMAPAIRKAHNAQLYAVASRDIRRAEALRPKKAYGAYSDLLCDPDVEAVYIASHNGLHHDLVLEALRNGKHVLCEKPLGVNERECESMLRAAEDADRFLVEAFMYRYHPQLAKAKELVATGAIGELMVVEASFRFRMSKADDVRLHPEWGGGALLDVGCYCINASRCFLGDTPSGISAVASFDHLHGIDTSVQGVLAYESERYAIISCGFDGGLHQRLSLIGSQGVIHLNEPFIAWTSHPRLTLLVGRDEQVFTFAEVDTFQLEVEDLATAILGESQPLLAADEGLLNARVLELIRNCFSGGTTTRLLGPT